MGGNPKLPVELSAAATVRLVAETIGMVLQVDNGRIQRVTLPLNQPVRLEHRIWVSLVDVLLVNYMYEQLLEKVSALRYD